MAVKAQILTTRPPGSSQSDFFFHQNTHTHTYILTYVYQGVPWPWHTVRAQRYLTIITSICIQRPAQWTGPQMSGRSEMVSWADSIMPLPSWRSCGGIPRSLSMKHKLRGLPWEPQLWAPTRSFPHPWSQQGVLPTTGPCSLSLCTCLSVDCPPTGMAQL